MNTDKSVFEYSNLKTFSLRENNIGDKGCIALSENLPRLRVKILLKETKILNNRSMNSISPVPSSILGIILYLLKMQKHIFFNLTSFLGESAEALPEFSRASVGPHTRRIYVRVILI